MRAMRRIVFAAAFACAASAASALTWDFEKPEHFQAWKAINGEWKVEKGALVNVFDGTPAKRAHAGEAAWKDYTIEADVTITDHNWVGIVFRAQDDFEYYVAYLNVPDNKSELWRHKKGGHDQRDAINSNFAAKGVRIDRGVPMHVTLVVEGDVFALSIDGEPQWEATDPAGLYKAGKVGAWTWASGASFDNYSVNGPGIASSLAVDPAGKTAVTWAALKR